MTTSCSTRASPARTVQGRVAEQDEEIGRRIEAALRAQHLPVEWNGSSQQRISVGPLTWQRRLPA
ncbi:DUF6891 domain-containing protein [Kribbella sancticallisti]|uniref:DUF6891 domain-containing protein n=1 Tax=Kribbella sancticallisti TaxID=460087 RepID=UPI003CD06034